MLKPVLMNGVVAAAQQKEMNELYDMLEEQKAEIDRLNTMLDRLDHPHRGTSTSTSMVYNSTCML